MQGENQQLAGGRELNYLAQKDSYLGSFLSRVVVAVNQLATNAGVAAVGKTSPPPKVDAVSVQGTLNGPSGTQPGVFVCPGEIFHATFTHNQSINKGVRYFSEIDTSPSFPAPHVFDHGTGRTALLNLPTFLNDGKTVQTYYHRAYAQYPGSDPSEPKVFGNLGGAIGIQMSGTNACTLLPSPGSGTASQTGEQGGKGLGTVLKRQAPQAKRQLARL